MGPARLAEGLLAINHIYQGKHELRILTTDAKDDSDFVYKMDVRYPGFLRFFDFIFRGWSFYKNISNIRNQFELDVVLFGHSMNGLIPKYLLKDTCMGGFVNDYYHAGAKFNKVLKMEGGLSLFLLSFVERWATKKLDFTIVCSEYLKRLILTNYRQSDGKVCLLYQSVKIQEIPFKPRSFGILDSIKILFVKRRHLVGGLPDLAIALGKLPEFDFQVTVIGPDKELTKDVMSLFESTSNASVRLLGKCSTEQVHEQMAINDILCNPSLMESQGLANVEGLAHGISVVSSNAGGIPEVLDFGNNGWLCEPGNPDSLAAALIACILANDAERKKKSERGRKFVEKHFDHTVMLDNLLRILESQIQSA